MTDMRAMFALARPAFGDFIAIVRRRWWLIASIAIVSAALDPHIVQSQPAAAEFARWIDGGSFAALIVSVFVTPVSIGIVWIFADVMRLRWPKYVLNWRRLGYLFVLGLAFNIVAVGIVIMLYDLLETPLPFMIGYVADVLIFTKMIFLFYASNEGGNPASTSWRLTNGRAFWPSFLLVAIVIAINRFADHQGFITSPLLLAGLGPLCLLLLMAFFSPWKIRWMAALEEAEALCRDEAISA
ncbi:MAG TPA: hypothetical protein VIJ12_06275 [Candidatus Baltobacteraceae bacterium]